LNVIGCWITESLRKIVEDTGEALNIEVPGKGSVQVSAGSEAKFKGLMPVLDEAAFLEMPDARREKLIADQVVSMEKQWTKASKPSVTVRL
jgi:hypothetical protein